MYFNEHVAEKYGVNEAIFIQSFYWWIKQNRANNNNFHDGRYWTYNTMDKYEERFPFWSAHQIKRLLKKMENNGIIVVGNYNKTKYDRTNWYTLSEDVLLALEMIQLESEKSQKDNDNSNSKNDRIQEENKPSFSDNLDEKQNRHIQSAKSQNGSDETVKSNGRIRTIKWTESPNQTDETAPPIPVSIPDINTVNNSVSKIHSFNLEQQDLDFLENFSERGMKELESEIKDQINYDCLAGRFDPNQINEIVEIILEIYMCVNPFISIGEERISLQLVQRRFEQLDFERVEMVMLNIQSTKNKIVNHKAYMLKCLYNMPTTFNTQVQLDVNHALA